MIASLRWSTVDSLIRTVHGFSRGGTLLSRASPAHFRSIHNPLKVMDLSTKPTPALQGQRRPVGLEAFRGEMAIRPNERIPQRDGFDHESKSKPGYTSIPTLALEPVSQTPVACFTLYKRPVGSSRPDGVYLKLVLLPRHRNIQAYGALLRWLSRFLFSRHFGCTHLTGRSEYA